MPIYVDGVEIPLAIEAKGGEAIEAFLEDPEAAVEKYVPEGHPDQWARVDFASDEAGERAIAMGLVPGDFEDYDGSAKSGAFTVKDIEEIAAEKEA